MTRKMKKLNVSSAKDPYEWVRCCNPSCGKWRSLLRVMDASSIIESAKHGEWFCIVYRKDLVHNWTKRRIEHLEFNILGDKVQDSSRFSI